MEKKLIFNVKDIVIATNDQPLGDSDYAPSLIVEKAYLVKTICYDRKGNQHLDVGLISELNYITSQETGEQLEGGDKIHWCHPSRFIKAEQT